MPSGSPVVVGYFPSWGVYGRDYHASEVPADRITHLNYAFANISAQGEVVLGDPYADIDKFYPGDSWDAGALRGSFHQLQLLKQANPELSTLISVGGWTWSGRFSDVALTSASRSRFAASAVAFIRAYGFDGVDIDWEYPVTGGLDTNVRRAEDGRNYTLLLQELRRQLDAAGAADGRTYLLTIAAPAGEWVAQHLERSQIAATVDWINLMTYDLHGPWDGVTGHHAGLADPSGAGLSAMDTVQRYRDAGVPASKLVVGSPFYGRSWTGVGSTLNGLGQSSTGEGPGTWESGMLDYWDLEARFINKNGYARFWDPQAQAPYLYNPSTKIWISYEDAQSATARGALVRTQGLRGVMFWELSGDTATHTLLDALRSGLGL